jgi:hypothetical protein
VIEMKKQQAITLWKAFNETTQVGELIKKYDTKPGYGGPRTLMRYRKAAQGFEKGLTKEEIAKSTQWSIDYVNRIYVWWEGMFRKPNFSSTDVHSTRGDSTDAIRSRPTITESELKNLNIHREAIRTSARRLSSQFNRPSLNSILDITFQLDAFKTPGKHKAFGSNPMNYLEWEVDKSGQVKLVDEYRIEGEYGEEPELHEKLMDHLSSSRFKKITERIESRSSIGGDLLFKCNNLINVLDDEVKVDTMVSNQMQSLNMGKSGMYYQYKTTILEYSVKCASSCFKPRPIRIRNEIFPHIIYSPRDVRYEMEYPYGEDQSLFLLKIERKTIAFSDTQETITAYQKLHRNLIERYSSLPEAIEVAKSLVMYEEYNKALADDLKEFANKPILQGQCKGC